MTRSARSGRSTARQPQVTLRQSNYLWLFALPSFWIAALVAYAPVLHGDFLWDDVGHLTRPDLTPLSGIWRIWFDIGATQQYYPVVHSAFWLFSHLWGGDTLGYHVVNVILHATSAYLIVVILRRLAEPGAWIAGALFLLHPVHVESVAWMAELKNTLSGVFYLASFLTYLHFDEKRDKRTYILAWVLFVLAVFSKTVAATLPAALLVTFWWKRGRIAWRDVRPLVPFFVVGAAGGIVTAWFEHSLIGANGAEYDFSILQRVLIAGRVIVFYVAKLAWPSPLLFIYPRWNVNQTVWWQYLYPAAVAAVFVVCWRLRPRTRGPLAIALLFIGTLVPALGFVNVYPFRFSFVADHFQYLASIPVLAAAAALVMAVGQHLRWPEKRTTIVAVAAAAVLLGGLTWRQSHVYVNEQQLWNATLSGNTGCWMCYDNLTLLRSNAGDFDGAMTQALASVAVNPNNATAHYNLGTLYQRQAKADEAIREFRESIRLRPGLVAAHQELGITLREAGKRTEALQELRRTVELAPSSTAAHLFLGLGLADAGRFEEAEAQFKETLNLNPNIAEAHDGLAEIARQRNQIADAVEESRLAAELGPSAERYNNLGTNLMQLDRVPEGTAAFEHAVQLAPALPLVHFNLGLAYRQLGRREDAVRELNEALTLAPNYAEARAALDETK